MPKNWTNMNRLRVRLTVICFIILLKVCVLVRGGYLVEVELYGYSNPTQTCQDCRSGGQFANPGCCDRHDRSICNGGDRCDSYFFYCLRTIGTTGRNCSYFGNRVSVVNSEDQLVDFNQSSVLGLENPLQLLGLTDAYESGIQLYIEIRDRDSEHYNEDDLVDAVIIDYNSPIGTNSRRRNYNGEYGFVTMDLGIAVSCNENFRGSNCTLCVPGSSCDSAAVDDNYCVGVDCGSGDCVGDSDSFRCVCDPGFAGDFCDNASTNAMDEERPQGSDLIGPIIGGVLGGLCLLLILLLLTATVILVKILFYRKSKLDKTAYARQELVPKGQGMKTAINQLHDFDGSPSGRQHMDNLPLYEEIKFKAQYVNISPSDSSTRADSVLVSNPLYGDENTKLNHAAGDRFDHYDRTIHQPLPPASATADKEFSASYGCINLQVSIEDNVAYAYGRRDSAACDSELEDNPLYGGDLEAVTLASPHDQYDQTFQPPQSSEDGVNQVASHSKFSPGPEATCGIHAYDYIDAKI